MKVVYTEESPYASYAAMDIARKASIALDQYPDVFTSPDHQIKLYHVQTITKRFLEGHGTIYQTARLPTKKRPVHTEVKFCHVYYPSKKRDVLLKNFRTSLEQLGIDPDVQVIRKPRTSSLSIHVY